MKRPKEDAKRWFRQAEYDLKVARSNLKNGFSASACFMAEQSAQKAINAYLYFKGARFVLERSLAKLIKECKDRDFRKILKYGQKLDQYYIPTRYPDALAPPAVPFESYPLEQAKEALRYGQKILKLARRKIK